MAFLLKDLIGSALRIYTAPYFENLDLNTINFGLNQGNATFSKLKLKRGALDKFRLPVDVKEGYVGKLKMKIPWLSLGTKPCEVDLEDVYLLVVPGAASKYDPAEDEKRKQDVKQTRLESAELIELRAESATAQDDGAQQQGFLSSVISKIVNNIQITVKNVHVRYEDSLSNPGHPFAAGVTLAGFTVHSTDGNWERAFVESTKQIIYKLARLDSMAVYFDTESESLAGLPTDTAIARSTALIATPDRTPKHQFLVKPISAEGKVTIHPTFDATTPRIDVSIALEEIGLVVDNEQYRDVISTVDMFHFYVRHNQYRKFRDGIAEQQSRPKALLQFAGRAILAEIHDKNKRWSWAWFAQRRDERRKYVDLFKKSKVSTLAPPEQNELQALERRLEYEDIRFYRSIARSQLRKDAAARKSIEERRKREQPQQSSGGWLSWAWGSSGSNTGASDTSLETLDEDKKQELYEAVEYDEKAAIAASFVTQRDTLKMRINAELNKGTFDLRSDPHGANTEVLSVLFSNFSARVLQRPDNFEARVGLGGFSVYDGTTQDTPYHQIVRVKDEHSRAMSIAAESDLDLDNADGRANRFFFAKYEQNPLDERADNALTVRLRYMEIIYHKEFVEAIFAFFKPPGSQLESVEALLDAASETLEGLRKETRAGLEYALQSHKTLDIKLDMNAPIIIIPEKITTTQCRHLLVDAGHISVKSDLADKEARHALQQKRSQPYTDDDLRNLENLMYDKFFLNLKSAQFVIGNDMESSLAALHEDSAAAQSLHILERINIDLSVQKSIVPSAVYLPRMRVSGRLPELKVNFSDAKYKALMRFIDVAIPKLGDDDDVSTGTTRPPLRPAGGDDKSNTRFRLPSVFRGDKIEYNVEDNEEEEPDKDGEDEFFEASDGVAADIHQHAFEINFTVDKLQAAMAKVARDGSERVLGDVVLQDFDFGFVLRKFDMKVDVDLRSLAVNSFSAKGQPMTLLTSKADEVKEERDLMAVKYKRVQKNSPEFLTAFEGIDQSIDVALSTFVLHAEPEPVITIFNFVMTTFVPGNDAPQQSTPAPTPAAEVKPELSTQIVLPPGQTAVPAPPSDKISVHAKLDSFQVILENVGIRLATLSLSAADVTVLVAGPELRVAARLQDISLKDDTNKSTSQPESSQLLSIEGNEVANLVYQTYDVSKQPSASSVNSSVSFHVGALKFRFLEQPLHGIYSFLIKLARLKSLYDAAAQAAVQRASEIEVQKMKLDVSVQSPVIYIPWSERDERDMLVVRLGAIKAENTFTENENQMRASLRGIQVASTFFHNDQPSTLKLVDDIEISAAIFQPLRVDRSVDTRLPDTRVSVNLSDIKLALTQTQYQLLMALASSIPRVFAADGASEASVPSTPAVPLTPPPSSASLPTYGSTDLQPELAVSSDATERVWTTLDVEVIVRAIKLQLFNANASDEASLKNSGIARFALNDNAVRLKMLSDGAMEAEVVLKSFTVGNTFPGASRFREIIPAAKHDRNQFMILYTSSGGTEKSQLAVVNVDSPQIIFAVDPVFALLGFFTSGVQADISQSPIEETPLITQATNEAAPASTLDFRVDLHDVSISVLENDAEGDTQAIELSIKQIALSQQGVLAVKVEKLGMSLLQMNAPQDKVSFIDAFSITMSMDGTKMVQQQITNINVNVDPIVLRASYRDINLIMAIANKAIELSTSGNAGKAPSPVPLDRLPTSSASPKSSKRALASPTFITSSVGSAPRLILTKEELNAEFGGFRLVLIGDAHEMPVLDLQTKRFLAKAKDWSGELDASTAISTDIKYFNFTNSYWEPLVEQWGFSVKVTKDDPNGAMSVKLSSRDRLELNVCATAMELALAAVNSMTKEMDRSRKHKRGGDAPYRIVNHTGHDVRVWTEGRTETGRTLSDGTTADWAFDDWRTVRENVSSVGRHNRLSVQVQGKPWEAVQGIPVDREGQRSIVLRPKLEPLGTRLLCDITVDNNVKIVTLRSSFKIENKTLYPIEISLGIDSQPYMVKKLPPNQDFSLPLTSETHNIRIRPDAGFGYRFSHALDWQALLRQPVQSIACQHDSAVAGSAVPQKNQEPPFHFHACAAYDTSDANSRKYPRLTVRLFSPLEVENLLPYDVDYLVFDKNTNQSWGTFLRRGGRMPVHSVQLSHLVLLNVKIQDPAYNPSDFAIINTDNSSDFEIERRLSLQDNQGRKLWLRVNYVRFPDARGAFKAQIYAPFVILNKTGMAFNVRSGRGPGAAREIASVPAWSALEDAKPIVLAPNKDSEFSFKFDRSGWSNPLPFNAPSAESDLVVPSAGGTTPAYFNFGVSWKEGEGKYKLSKVITITPRYIVKNSLPDAILFREKSVPLHDQSKLDPGQRVPFQTFKNQRDHLFTFAYPGLNTTWSEGVDINALGSTHVRLGDRASSHLLRVDVQMEGATIFVTLNRETHYPFLIENRSDFTIKFAQIDRGTQEPTILEWQQARSSNIYVLKPHMRTDYVWDRPAGLEKKLLIHAGDGVRPVDLNEIGDLPPFLFRDPTRSTPERSRDSVLALDVRADGKRQILTISTYHAETSLYKPRRSAYGTLSRQDTLTSVQGFEAVQQDTTPSFKFKLDFDGIGLSILNKRLLEVIYLSVKGIIVDYTGTTSSHGVTFSCQSIQLDNQLQEGLYPVVLQPTPLARNNSQISAPPVVQVSLIVLKDQAHGVTFVKYASVLLQALTVQTDEDFLFALFDLTKLKGVSWEHEQDTAVLIQEAGDIKEPTGTPQDATELYFEVLEFQPIQLSVSFMRTDRVNAEEKLVTSNPLSVVLNAVTMAVGNINDAALKMNTLAIRDMRVTVPELQDRIIYHYKQEVLRQIYRVLLSADFIGNPVGLFTNVSSGVKDVFYEPIYGVVHGTTDLPAGLAKGAASFVKKTVFGLSDTVTKVTGSIGKGLSAATLDSDFQEQRRLNQRRNKPKHLIYGVTAGAEAFGNSLASAAGGLILKPVAGVEQEGASGFFKGLGQGVVGLVTKPVVGVFDLASNVSEGVRNTTTVFDNPKLGRVRYPRLVPANGVLVQYSARESLGQSWMRDLEQGKYKKEMYVAHVELVDGDNVALLTTTRILSFSSRRLRLTWDLPFTSVTAVNIENNGIMFKDRSGPSMDRFLPIAQNSAKEWFFEEIARVVKDFNLKRREDR